MLSIIIPLYNKEKYVERCFESMVESCDLNNTEIIIVDDGSTDASGTMADRFAAQYDCVNVVHTQNRGVSAARNLGMGIAKGDYITFVDADDELIEGSYAKVLDYLDAKEGTDIFVCGAVWGNDVDAECDLQDEIVYQEKNKYCFDFFMTGGADNHIQSVAKKYMWGCKEKFYRRKFLSENDIIFKEDLKRQEDIIYSLECYYNAKKVRFLPINVYVNNVDPDGITGSMDMENNLLNFGIFFDYFEAEFPYVKAEDKAMFYFQYTLIILREAYLAKKNGSIDQNEYNQITSNWFSRKDITEMVQDMPQERLSLPKRVAFMLTKFKLYPLVGMELDIHELKEKEYTFLEI